MGARGQNGRFMAQRFFINPNQEIKCKKKGSCVSVCVCVCEREKDSVCIDMFKCLFQGSKRTYNISVCFPPHHSCSMCWFSEWSVIALMTFKRNSVIRNRQAGGFSISESCSRICYALKDNSIIWAEGHAVPQQKTIDVANLQSWGFRFPVMPWNQRGL